ncbi:MAG TPA: histidine kinase, partial [Thermoanaerobaculia bacterium]|nr:histidine kinase [Thermoanaerobaculia bacterium]
MATSRDALPTDSMWAPRRADAYLFAGFTLAALLASISIVTREDGLARAALLAVAPSLLFGVFAVAARYPSRVIPLASARWTLIAGAHLAGAFAAGYAWALSWRSWSRILAAAGVPARGIARPELEAAFGTGMLLYLIAVIAQYLLLEIERSDAARRAALGAALAARDAELRAFKAQVDPHFLFNSLNAIASLAGNRPADARVMAQRLADFFRLTVRFGKREKIRVSEEIDLARQYLEIEKTRFGPRLAAELAVDPAAESCGIPPLLLQPLVENAVRHGIAGLVDGGTIRIEATVSGGRLRIRVANPADPDRAASRGEGVGLANVRGRLAATSPSATLVAREAGGAFEAVVTM